MREGLWKNMDPNTALFVLSFLCKEDKKSGRVKYAEAERLGIEALERELTWRYNNPRQPRMLLPSETTNNDPGDSPGEKGVDIMADICTHKDVEILTLNIREDGGKMPPDVKHSLEQAIKALIHILNEHAGEIPTFDATKTTAGQSGPPSTAV